MIINQTININHCETPLKYNLTLSSQNRYALKTIHVSLDKKRFGNA